MVREKTLETMLMDWATTLQTFGTACWMLSMNPSCVMKSLTSFTVICS